MTPPTPRWPIVSVSIDAHYTAANVTVHGVTHHITAITPTSLRAAVTGHIADTIATPLGRPVRVHIAEPASSWEVAIEPDGTVHELNTDTPKTKQESRHSTPVPRTLVDLSGIKDAPLLWAMSIADTTGRPVAIWDTSYTVTAAQMISDHTAPVPSHQVHTTLPDHQLVTLMAQTGHDRVHVLAMANVDPDHITPIHTRLHGSWDHVVIGATTRTPNVTAWLAHADVVIRSTGPATDKLDEQLAAQDMQWPPHVTIDRHRTSRRKHTVHLPIDLQLPPGHPITNDDWEQRRPEWDRALTIVTHAHTKS